jgi:1-acyl-sn-glycerol-3-phosphate acyltransferase
LYRPWYFILLWHCCCSSLLTYNMHILFTFPDCIPSYVRVLHLSRTYSYYWCFFLLLLTTAVRRLEVCGWRRQMSKHVTLTGRYKASKGFQNFLWIRYL